MVPREQKNPACTEKVLTILYHIEDALCRQGISEASKYINDAIALIQNEIDWCYRTDTVLPFMLEYFLQLNDSLHNLPKGKPELYKAQVKEITDVVRATRHEIIHQPETATHASPEKPDALERQRICSEYR